MSIYPFQINLANKACSVHLTLGLPLCGVRQFQAVFYAFSFFPGLSVQDSLAGCLRRLRPTRRYPLRGRWRKSLGS